MWERESMRERAWERGHERENSEEKSEIRSEVRKVSPLQVPAVSCVVPLFLMVGAHWQFMVMTFIPYFPFIPYLWVVGRCVPQTGQITQHSHDGAGALGTMVVTKQCVPLIFWVTAASPLFVQNQLGSNSLELAQVRCRHPSSAWAAAYFSRSRLSQMLEYKGE